MAKVALDMQKVKLLFFDAAIAGLGVFFLAAVKAPLEWMAPTVVLATIGGRLLRPGRVARRYILPEMQSTFAPKWIELTGDRLRFVNESGVSKEFKLKSILEAKSIRDYFVLVSAPGEWQLVPKPAFRSDEDREAFRASLQRNVPKVKHL
jgi:hypothetical protein